MKNISLKFLYISNSLLLVLIISVLFSFSISNKVLAQEASDNSPDALAVRVIPNPHHLSAQRWYQLQGFTGSPQSMIVDGYKAIRDGRTVYVSATNIIDNKLYTNIYLISYDQRADQKTIDIFGRILKNWKFNNNIELNDQLGHCLISDKTCKKSSDCPDGYVCGNSGANLSGLQANKCVIAESDSENLKDTPVCILDSDCPSNLFCSGLKAKIVRDLDRLEKIVLLKEKIQNYYSVNGRYPIMGAGTYLPHVAISTWPSWQNSFLNQIGISSVSDPINKLGSCYDEEGKFNLDTCWNAVDNVFFLNSHNGAPVNHDNFILPAASYAITYLGNSNGSNYKLCATMETALDGHNYTLADGGLMSSNSCTVASLGTDFNIGSSASATNTAPYISSNKTLTGSAGNEFAASIMAKDAENHPIFWELVGPLDSVFQNNGWGLPLTIENTNNPNQKIIRARNAGRANTTGLYKFKIRLRDILGASREEGITINITPASPQIIAGDIEHNVSYGNDFQQDIGINFTNKIKSNGELCGAGANDRLVSICWGRNSCWANNTYKTQYAYNDNVEYSDIKNGFKAILKKIGTNNNWSLQIIKGAGGFINASDLGRFNYKIKVEDCHGDVNEKEFNINVTANNPVIDFSDCLKIVELGDNYSCTIRTANPEEGAEFVLLSDLPAGLSFDNSVSGEAKITGTISSIFSEKEIKVKASNDYQKSSEDSFKLSSISNCGSYLVEYPGGPWNANGTIRNQGGYYKTALIGNQCWLQDNLNVGTMIASSSSASSNNDIIEKYCLDDKSVNCDIYGGLYTWAEAVKSSEGASINYNKRGICPPGFRVALNSDWMILENYLNASSSPCRTASASSDGWKCDEGIGVGQKIRFIGINDFKALLGGYAIKGVGESSFSSVNSSSRFISTKELLSGSSQYREIMASEKGINRSASGASNSAMSLRCIKGDDGNVSSWPVESSDTPGSSD